MECDTAVDPNVHKTHRSTSINPDNLITHRSFVVCFNRRREKFRIFALPHLWLLRREGHPGSSFFSCLYALKRCMPSSSHLSLSHPYLFSLRVYESGKFRTKSTAVRDWSMPFNVVQNINCFLFAFLSLSFLFVVQTSGVCVWACLCMCKAGWERGRLHLGGKRARERERERLLHIHTSLARHCPSLPDESTRINLTPNTTQQISHSQNKCLNETQGLGITKSSQSHSPKAVQIV